MLETITRAGIEQVTSIVNTTAAHTACTCSPQFQHLNSKQAAQIRCQWKHPFKLNHRHAFILSYNPECCQLISSSYIFDGLKSKAFLQHQSLMLPFTCPSLTCITQYLHKVQLGSAFKCCQVTDLPPPAATSLPVTLHRCTHMKWISACRFVSWCHCCCVHTIWLNSEIQQQRYGLQDVMELKRKREAKCEGVSKTHKTFTSPDLTLL